ncbi:unnamed protein product [Caenorhabditis angaria]|uniref:Glycosyltransferase family 92 protein n=1 Tax=Caenorhabditis angaria TaxID=860376 RepID=A0A9P1IYZ7_9PELO|nr:unnamed protein product [Caenorhabditis angaria]
MNTRFYFNIPKDRNNFYLAALGCLVVFFGIYLIFSVLFSSNDNDFDDDNVTILKHTHAFIHSAYYYQKSETLGDNAIALVMSINKLTAENILDMNIKLLATNETLDRFPVKASLTSEHRFNGSCEYVTVLAQANTIENMGRLEIQGGNRVIDKLLFKKPLETSPSKVVFCVAPQLGAENWQEFLRQVHVAKRYGAHLHIYVISMVEKYFRLMKEYESLGYISLEPWLTVKYSHVRERVDEPNKNIEILQRTSAFTDCILNYKEAAEFVGSIEMEDLLFPIGSTSYYEEFEKQYDGSYLYSALTYARQTLLIPQTAEDSISVSSLFETVLAGDVSSYGRSFVRTSNYNSTWLHWSRNSDLIPREIQGNVTYLQHKQVEGCRIFNFKKADIGNDTRTEVIMDDKILAEIEEELKSHLELPQIKKLMAHLPRNKLYSPIFERCFETLTSSVSPQETVCMDMYSCELPRREDVPCIHSDGLYSSMIPMRPITYHYSSEHFFSRNIGCNV